MKFKFILIPVLLFLTACASDPTYSVKRPFLYEVSKDGRKGYLFGTMHVGVTDEDLPETFWPVFDHADVYAFEAGGTDKDEHSKLLELVLLRQPEDPQLASLLSASDYQKMKKLFEEHFPRKNSNFINRLSPAGAYFMLADMKARENKVRVSHGEYVRLNSKFMLDQKLIERALKNQKSPIYLDAGSSKSVMECIFLKQQHYKEKIVALLNDTSHSNDASIAGLRTLTNIYREGDAEALKAEFAIPSETDSCSLDERNKYWAPLIASMMKSYEHPMIAVGVAHIIIGPNSLTQLLEKDGYSVHRVELSLK